MSVTTVDVFSTVLPQVQASLKIAGRIRPARIADVLGIKVRGGTGKAGVVICEISTAREETIDLASPVESLLAMVRPHFDELRELIVENSLDVDVILYVSGAEMWSIYVDAIRIAELASMGAGLSIKLLG